MFPEISYEFNARDYKNMFEIPLIEKEVEGVIISFNGIIKAKKYSWISCWNKSSFRRINCSIMRIY